MGLKKTKTKDGTREKSIYEKEYTFFKSRLLNFKSEERLNRNLLREDKEIFLIKHLLADWIFWTSKSSFTRGNNKRPEISDEDLQIFKGYLLYLLKVKKNIEKVTIVLKILKRIIEKSGSYEWIENYKDILASIQSDFFEEYNSVLNIC